MPTIKQNVLSKRGVVGDKVGKGIKGYIFCPGHCCISNTVQYMENILPSSVQEELGSDNNDGYNIHNIMMR